MFNTWFVYETKSRPMPLQERMKFEREKLLFYQDRLRCARAMHNQRRYVIDHWTNRFVRQLDVVWEAQENLKCAQKHWA